jgi:mono/diheme cytochrome c family protein
MSWKDSSQRLLWPLASAMLALAAAPAATAADLSRSSGAQLYRQYCASCHGRSGEGDGPVAPFFKLLPPDLTLMARRRGGTFPAEQVRRIVDGREITAPHGAREMPVWGLQFAMAADEPTAGSAQAQAAIARLVEHLRTIQKLPTK